MANGKFKTREESTLILWNGQFQGFYGERPLVIEADEVIYERYWNCYVKNGVVICNATWEEEYRGIYNLRFKLYPNGYAILTLKTPLNVVKRLRSGYVTGKNDDRFTGYGKIVLAKTKNDKFIINFKPIFN